MSKTRKLAATTWINPSRQWGPSQPLTDADPRIGRIAGA
jgi:hypothetical protein